MCCSIASLSLSISLSHLCCSGSSCTQQSFHCHVDPQASRSFWTSHKVPEASPGVSIHSVHGTCFSSFAAVFLFFCGFKNFFMYVNCTAYIHAYLYISQRFLCYDCNYVCATGTCVVHANAGRIGYYVHACTSKTHCIRSFYKDISKDVHVLEVGAFRNP